MATRLVRLGAALVTATVALAFADLAASSGSVDLRRYERWLARGPRVTLPGLWAGASVSAEVRVRPLRRGGGATLKAGGAPARLAPGGEGPQAVQVEGLADLDGRLMLRALQRGSASLGRIAFRQQGPRRVPLLRLLQYGLLVGLAYGWGLLAGGAGGGRMASAAATLLASGALLAGCRVQTLVFLPWALLLLALAMLMAAAARRARLPRPATAFVTAVFLARTAVSLQPGFPSIDAGFHSENLQRFEAGEVTRSTAPGPGGVDVAVPYPPALYALLGPLAAVGWPTPQFPVLLAIALLEGTLPLLLFLLARAAGASEMAAALAACTLAALPESVLALGKGIAANALGQWVTLLLFLALVRRFHAVVLTGLFALAFLAHLGAGLILLAFVCCWAAWGLRSGASRSVTARVVACAAAGAVLSWLVYYREVQTLTTGVVGQLGSSAVGHAEAFFGVRWYRVGKTLQDLVLKFGAAPLFAAVLGLRRNDVPSELRALLWPWLMAGGGLGLVAILTPIPLRFEYFLGPALALAAGLGAEGMSRRGRMLTLAVPLLIQGLLAAFLWARRFNLISVIMESPRWPFPFRL